MSSTFLGIALVSRLPPYRIATDASCDWYSGARVVERDGRLAGDEVAQQIGLRQRQIVRIVECENRPLQRSADGHAAPGCRARLHFAASAA